jgi:hypothetical protein
MTRDFQVIHLTIDEECLNKASNRLRNQIVGCMHAYNELTILNRLLMFNVSHAAPSIANVPTIAAAPAPGRKVSMPKSSKRAAS